jgi:hypothetical protein
MARWPSIRERLGRPVERFRLGGREALTWTLRLTSVAVASYVVATLLLSSERPMLAPLTALLVTQATPVSLLTTGLDRVASVVVGVLLAVAVSVLVPLTWWSLAGVIGLSILIGQALRLRANLLEVPISAMLVLGVSAANTDAAAWNRVAETLVGAVVAVLTNLLLPPKITYASAAGSVEGLAARLASLLHRAAEATEQVAGDGPGIAAAAQQGLDGARRLSKEIPDIASAVEHVEEGRRLNVRMVRSLDAAPGLRQGLEVLEHCVVSLRSMLRAVRDATQDESWPADDSGRDAAVDFVAVLRALGDAVAAFGQLVRTEATSVDLQAPEREAAVRQALEGMHSASTLLFERGADQNAALAELYVNLGSTMKRVRRELDLEDRALRQDVLRPPRRPVRDVISPRRPRRRPADE